MRLKHSRLASTRDSGSHVSDPIPSVSTRRQHTLKVLVACAGFIVFVAVYSLLVKYNDDVLAAMLSRSRGEIVLYWY
ncbi:hypothetical protein KIPB_015778 [Kipferlia bialata]|uniref:Uncharacterized protein n=1 Tax=Kipferlia bialata TaxID=797122 RepID=A0A9K3GQE7_9EUKA|nr:hypothetical protein KIPB_015778 [Kipferlia bialata]|eukprot:g15778.t1